MKKFKKSAAALAVVLAASALAGCEERQSDSPSGSTSAQSVQSAAEQSRAEQQSAQSSQEKQDVSAEQSAVSQTESLTEEQYKAKVINCTAQWVIVLYESENAAAVTLASDADFIEALSKNDREKLKKDLIECAQKAEVALAPLEGIAPPEGMTEFHGEFLKFEKILRLYNSTLKEIAQTDLEDTSLIESIGENFQNKAESFDIDSFMKNYKWFADGVENSEIIRKNLAIAEYTEKSNVTSADSDAKTVMYAVNLWIVDNMNNGGNAPAEGTVKISWSGGEVSVSGAITDADKANNTPQTLTEHLKENFRGLMDGYAEVYLNADGKAFAAIYALDASSLDSAEHPALSDFEKGSWKWNGKTAGISPSGNIVGTAPKVVLDKQ